MTTLSATQLARIVIRLGLGINMLMHGAVRIPKLSGFVDKMAGGFAGTILPEVFVRSFLYVLPFVELTTGLLILIGGRFSKWGYFVGGLVIAALLFGTTLKEDWGTAGTQLVYVLAFYLALRGLDAPTPRQD